MILASMFEWFEFPRTFWHLEILIWISRTFCTWWNFNLNFPALLRGKEKKCGKLKIHQMKKSGKFMLQYTKCQKLREFFFILYFKNCAKFWLRFPIVKAREKIPRIVQKRVSLFPYILCMYFYFFWVKCVILMQKKRNKEQNWFLFIGFLHVAKTESQSHYFLLSHWMTLITRCDLICIWRVSKKCIKRVY